MAHNPDSTVLCLVYEFFHSQFELRDEVCPLNSEEYLDHNLMQDDDYERISTVLRSQGQFYVQNFMDRIDAQIEAFLPGLQPPNGPAAFNTLSNSIFNEGIDWNLILTYFVFSAELAFQANVRGLATVDNVARWLVQYTSEHLLPWITVNGGWNGIVAFFPEQVESQQKPNLPRYYGVGAAAIGVLSLGIFLSRS